MSFTGVFLLVLPIGLFFGGMFTIGLSGFRRFLVTLLISAVISGVISGLLFFEKEQDVDTWNSGVCPNCSTEWRLVNVEHLRHGGNIYFYTCDSCGKVIETKHSMGG